MSDRLLVAFSTEAALRNAVQRFEALDLGSIETYTPASMSGEADDRTVPLVMLAGGLLFAAAGFGMQVYANAASYPLDIGGRPEFSWPAFIPIAFEIGVLFALFSGVCGYFAVGGMLKLYEPIDECPSMRHATRDRWILAIRIRDRSAEQRAREIAQGLHPIAIEEIPP